MKSKQISIEFIGVSGIGKSTLVEEVMSLLKKQNINYVDLTTYKKTVFGNIAPLMKTLFIVSIFKPKSLKGFIQTFKKIGSHLITIHKGKNKNGIRVFDEGIFQKANAVARRYCNMEPLSFLNKSFKYIEKPDMLIVLEADPKLVFERRLKRNKPNDDLNYENIVRRHELLNKGEDFNKALNNFNKEIKIIKLSNNSEDDLIKNAHKIVEVLKNIS